MKIDLTQFIATILGSVISGIMLWAVKELNATIKAFRKEIADFRNEFLILRTEFHLFKERTDSIPGMQENIANAHKRINDITGTNRGGLSEKV